MVLVYGWHFCHPKGENKQNFLQHINSVDLAIQFSVQNNKKEGAIPFLDTIVKPESDGKLSITVFRRPTHMDQYLQWDCHNHLSAKYIVISTLPIRPKQSVAILSSLKHIRESLTNCKYPKWTLDKVEKRLTTSTRQVNDVTNNQSTADTQPTTNKDKTKGYIVIPYTWGLYKSIKPICWRYGIQTHFKGNSTIKNLLVFPKDKDPIVNESWAIYWFQCGDLTCDDEYKGETSRTFGERFKEHLKDPSPIHHHSSNTGHPTTQQNFQKIGREGHGLARNIKESILLYLLSYFK